MTNSKPLQTKHWLALLGTLFVIVLIAHLTLISSARGQFGTIKSVSTEAFTTRTIELLAAKPAPEKAPEVVPPLPRTSAQKLAKPVDKAVSTSLEAPSAPSQPVETAVLTDTPQPQISFTSPTMTPIANEPTPAPEPVVSQVSASASAPAASGDTNLPPPNFVASNTGLHIYKVIFTKNGVINQGDAQFMLRQDGETYLSNLLITYTLLIKTFNVFEFNSTGMLTPQGLKPQRFSDKRFNKSEVASHFDYSSGKINFSANKPEVVLQEGAQDRVSLFWQLSGLLSAQASRYTPGSTLTVQTVSASDAEPWLFTVNELETLNLSTGPQSALRLTRNPRREFDQKIELWFAPSLNYLPVRFRFTETNGDYYDAYWQNVQPLPNVSL